MTTQTFYVSFLHCDGCVRKVTDLVSALPGVKSARLDYETGKLEVEANGSIDTTLIKTSIETAGRWRLVDSSEKVEHYNLEKLENSLSAGKAGNQKTESSKQKLENLRRFLPLATFILAAIILGTVWQKWNNLHGVHGWMQGFMGMFFVIFGGMKVFNFREFAQSFSQYDILARRFNWYGKIYPFLEFLLGVAFLSGLCLVAANLVTLIIMLLGTVGIAQKLQSKSSIKCACLGGFFDVPITWFTVVENLAMAGMAAWMLIA